jgi:DNA replication licensing factor MCM4
MAPHLLRGMPGPHGHPGCQGPAQVPCVQGAWIQLATYRIALLIAACSRGIDSGVTPGRSRRGDLQFSDLRSTPSHRRLLYVDEQGVPIGQLTSDAAGVHSDAPTYSAGPTSELLDGPKRLIWGTNVSVEECTQAFRKFLREFKRKYRMRQENEFVAPGQGEELVYQDMMKQMLQLETTCLNLDVQNLKAFPPTKKFYHQLHAYPQECIPIMDTAVKDEMLEHLLSIGADEEYDRCLGKNYKARPFNCDKSINMRDLNPSGTSIVGLR